ncbi:MAG: CooT family nickel-binding protein [Chloroflexi bacterium]|nr:CooT family nickel-binding protein [Chloroflexota bacterium]
MCLSKAYVEKAGKKELVLEEVALLKLKGGKVFLKTLFGEEREIGANLKEVDFLSHTLLLGYAKEPR